MNTEDLAKEAQYQEAAEKSMQLETKVLTDIFVTDNVKRMRFGLFIIYWVSVIMLVSWRSRVPLPTAGYLSITWHSPYPPGHEL